MELIYIVIAVLIILLPVALSKLLARRSRDTNKVLGTEPPSKPPSTPRSRTVAQTGADVREASGLPTQGRKIDAIKLVRDKTGLDLKEAKEAVDSMEKPPATSQPPASLAATIRRAQDTSDEVQKLVAKGRKIEAIKLIRDRTGIGLKEAKDLVDRLG